MSRAKIAFAAALASTLSACASSMSVPEVPAAVAVPAGQRMVMNLKGTGSITYECRVKTGAAGEHQWVFLAPDAVLTEAGGRTVGKYYGGPTWEHVGGGRITGRQVAVAPAGPGAIPLQLVQTSPATGGGPFQGVTYIQRVNTVGGVAPSAPCDASTVGTQQMVGYSADYVFYKP